LSNAKYAGAIPLLIVLTGLLILLLSLYPEQNLPRNLVFELPAPFSSAHSIFLSISALIVAYFFARSSVSKASSNLIALGSASLILGFGFLVSQILGNPPFGGPNQLVGISSLVFLFSGLFYGAFSTLSLFGKTISPGNPKLTLLAAYVVGVALVVVVILSIETNLLPDFFVPGKGPTLLRQTALGAAVVLFSYSAVVLMRSYRQRKIAVLFWFSLGLAANAIGYLSALFGKVPGGPFSWLGRISLILGGLYFGASILAAYEKTDDRTGKSREPAES
jgi:hypothetical protein